MNALTRAAVLGLVVASTRLATADSWPLPRPQIFASSSGAYGFKMQPPNPPVAPLHGRSQGILFALAPDGTETVIWQSELVNIPVTSLPTSIWRRCSPGMKSPTRSSSHLVPGTG
jgi:hypothetical protein